MISVLIVYIQFIESQQNQLAKLKLGSRKKSSDNFTRRPVEPFPIKKTQHKTPTPPPIQPHQPSEQGFVRDFL